MHPIRWTVTRLNMCTIGTKLIKTVTKKRKSLSTFHDKTQAYNVLPKLAQFEKQCTRSQNY